MTYRVLMVCTGNICRSVMAKMVLEQRLDGLDVHVDSVGISAEEFGNPIDYRAAETLRVSGYDVSDHSARQISARDLEDYDLILAMTQGHYRGVQRLAQRSGVDVQDLRMYREFDPEADGDLEVPDPWYGDMNDFAITMETVERATGPLVEYLAGRSE